MSGYSREKLCTALSRWMFAKSAAGPVTKIVLGYRGAKVPLETYDVESNRYSLEDLIDMIDDKIVTTSDCTPGHSYFHLLCFRSDARTADASALFDRYVPEAEDEVGGIVDMMPVPGKSKGGTMDPGTVMHVQVMAAIWLRSVNQLLERNSRDTDAMRRRLDQQDAYILNEQENKLKLFDMMQTLIDRSEERMLNRAREQRRDKIVVESFEMAKNWFPIIVSKFDPNAKLLAAPGGPGFPDEESTKTVSQFFREMAMKDPSRIPKLLSIFKMSQQALVKFIFGKILNGEPLNDADRGGLFMIFEGMEGAQYAAMRKLFSDEEWKTLMEFVMSLMPAEETASSPEPEKVQ